MKLFEKKERRFCEVKSVFSCPQHERNRKNPTEKCQLYNQCEWKFVRRLTENPKWNWLGKTTLYRKGERIRFESEEKKKKTKIPNCLNKNREKQKKSWRENRCGRFHLDWFRWDVFRETYARAFGWCVSCVCVFICLLVIYVYVFICSERMCFCVQRREKKKPKTIWTGSHTWATPNRNGFSVVALFRVVEN